MKSVKFVMAVAVLLATHSSFADSNTAVVADVKTQETTKVCTQKSAVSLWDNTNPAKVGTSATRGTGTVK
jgi:hypothetical protein